MTRQNITYVVNKLIHFNLNFTSIHFIVIQRVMRYLANILKLNIRFESFNNFEQIDNLIIYRYFLCRRCKYETFLFKLCIFFMKRIY